MLDPITLRHPNYPHTVNCMIMIPQGAHLFFPNGEYMGKWVDDGNAYSQLRIDYEKSYEHSGFYVLYFIKKYNSGFDLDWFSSRCVKDGTGIPSRGQEVLW